MSIKLITLLRSRPGSDADDFDRFLSGDFTARVRGAGSGAGIVAAVVNRVEVMNYRHGAPTNREGHVWSTIMEYYFNDAATAVAAVEDTVLPAILASGDRIAGSANVVVNEFPMYDKLAVADPVKVYGFFRIVFDMTRRQVFDHWYGPHADLGREIGADQVIAKYLQNHTLETYHERDPRYDYDGASVVYFDDYDAAARIYRNPAVMGTMEPDERKMGTEPAAVVSIAARERILFDERAALVLA